MAVRTTVPDGRVAGTPSDGAVVEEVAARHGFAASSRRVDGAGEQSASMVSDRGGNVSVTSTERFGTRVTSDCYLTAEAKVEG